MKIHPEDYLISSLLVGNEKSFINISVGIERKNMNLSLSTIYPYFMILHIIKDYLIIQSFSSQHIEQS